PRTAAGEEGRAPGSGARQWLPWTQATDPSSEEASPDGPREPRGAGAAEDDAPDPPGTFSLRGAVTDAAGQPLEGVHVRAEPSSTPLSGVQVELYAVEHQRLVPLEISDGEVHEEPQEAEEHTIRALQDSMTTQQDGTFILDTPKPGTWLVRAQSQGLHPIE